MPPVAYLRRSRVDARKSGIVSHEQQVNAVRELVAKHGDDTDRVVWLEDWGKSGRIEKQHLRTGFAELERMVRDGEATALYTYSANRLARSLESLARLTKACEERKVPIRCADGYSPDVSTSTGRMVVGILGSVYAWQAEWTSESAVGGVEVRRSRGDWIGPAPWGKRVVGGKLVDNPDEHVEDVARAFREAGTYQGAARLLKARKVNSRRGRWAASAVRSILRYGKPEMISPTTHRGRPPKKDFRLSGLLRCPCGATLSGKNERGGTVSYLCQRAGEDPDHSRPRSVAESKVLPWVEAEAARYRQPPDEHTDRALVEEKRSELVARRERVGIALIDGLIDRAEALKQARAIDDELTGLPATATPPRLRPIDPATWSPREYNDVLRSLFRGIDLGSDLKPTHAEWRDPSWRDIEP
jgi:DNA invertase Pin-like site-specific DNA recombinase